MSKSSRVGDFQSKFKQKHPLWGRRFCGGIAQWPWRHRQKLQGPLFHFRDTGFWPSFLPVAGEGMWESGERSRGRPVKRNSPCCGKVARPLCLSLDEHKPQTSQADIWKFLNLAVFAKFLTSSTHFHPCWMSRSSKSLLSFEWRKCNLSLFSQQGDGKGYLWRWRISALSAASRVYSIFKYHSPGYLPFAKIIKLIRCFQVK